MLPSGYRALDGIARILELPDGSGWHVEEQWLGAARRARRVFDAVFYDL
jgi:glutamate-ammonia-ligase adenylyltransferase